MSGLPGKLVHAEARGIRSERARAYGEADRTPNEGTGTMASNAGRPDREPSTWAAVVARIVEIGSESWVKLIRVSILIVLLGAVLWLVASAG